ncbi:hypothetical protein [Desulfoluna sp.]|uniref:hypothetical protein n=1 Tax=Desulfoluna sp. TaxID=2045199 RepID=UPI00260C7523|nr:hypothetical protein [Desulfoluna sp.]
MTKQRALTLLLSLLLLPALTWADTFSTMGTRWPSGLKKTLTGNTATLFAANGDILSAYSKEPFELKAQIELHAPEGIIAIDYMKIEEMVGIPDRHYVIASCGSGGLQVVEFEGSSFSLSPDAIVDESTTVKPDTPSPTPLSIKNSVGFTAESAHLIAAIDDNFGYRVFQFTTTPTLVEVTQQMLSDKTYTMLVDLARWENSVPGENDYILTVAKNREIGLLNIQKTSLGEWVIKGLDKATLTIPSVPSTELLYMSSLTLRVAGNKAHVIENSLGNFFTFRVNTAPPYLTQIYPLPDTEGVALGYPLDLAPQGDHACFATLMEKNGHLPGVQVMQLSDKAIVGTYEQSGAGALHRSSETPFLFLMDLKNGLSKINVSITENPERVGDPLPTPFAVADLLARETYLFMVDDLESWTDSKGKIHSGGFRVMDIANATQPKRLFFMPTEGQACDLAVDGNFYRLFVADTEKGVQCYSLNSNLIPEGKTAHDFGGEGQIPVPSSEAPCHLQTLSADAIGGNALKVVTTYKNINNVNTGFLHILTEANTLVSVKLPTDDTNPTIDLTPSSSIHLPDEPQAIHPFLRDYVLTACGSEGLQVVDLFSNPDTPGTLSPVIEAFHTVGLSNTVSVSSDGSRYAYIADDTAGIVAFDLFSDPNTPAVINLRQTSQYTLEKGKFTDLFVTDNNNLYAITDQPIDNILIFDISDPSIIRLHACETSLGNPTAIIAATTGGLELDQPSLRAAYVADGQGGLAIRQATDDDNSQVQTWKDDATTCFINTLH